MTDSNIEHWLVHFEKILEKHYENSNKFYVSRSKNSIRSNFEIYVKRRDQLKYEMFGNEKISKKINIYKILALFIHVCVEKPLFEVHETKTNRFGEYADLSSIFINERFCIHILSVVLPAWSEQVHKDEGKNFNFDIKKFDNEFRNCFIKILYSYQKALRRFLDEYTLEENIKNDLFFINIFSFVEIIHFIQQRYVIETET
jgi:hypothetical protein